MSSEAFELRLDRNEEYLSVNWLEDTGKADIDSQLEIVRSTIGLELKANDRFARINVGKSKQRVLQHTRVRLTFRKIAEGSTHSGIFGIAQVKRINGAVAFQLAELARGNLYSAVVDAPSKE